MAILKEAGVNNEEILICSGYGFADSLSASASGRPILIVDNSLSSEQLTYLKSINSRKYTIIGDIYPWAELLRERLWEWELQQEYLEKTDIELQQKLQSFSLKNLIV